MSQEFGPDVDNETPNVARVYDYYLGGGANFKPDRDFAKKVLTLVPEARLFATSNRRFQARALEHVAEAGVTQFLDLGSGIPTARPTHEVVRETHPHARVAYVENEPVAVAHSRQLIGDDPNSLVVAANLEDTDTVLDAAGALLDFTKPVCVMMLAILHFIRDEDTDPRRIVASYAAAVPQGSWLVLSHTAADGPMAERINAAAEHYTGASSQGAQTRTRSEVANLVDGFELVEPGVVWTRAWRPDEPSEAEHPEYSCAYGLVGRKP